MASAVAAPTPARVSSSDAVAVLMSMRPERSTVGSTASWTMIGAAGRDLLVGEDGESDDGGYRGDCDGQPADQGGSGEDRRLMLRLWWSDVLPLTAEGGR